MAVCVHLEMEVRNKMKQECRLTVVFTVFYTFDGIVVCSNNRLVRRVKIESIDSKVIVKD